MMALGPGYIDEIILCNQIKEITLNDHTSPDSSPDDSDPCAGPCPVPCAGPCSVPCSGPCPGPPNPDNFSFTYIYVISNKVYSDHYMYKIGKHTGTKKKLIKRYKTYLIEPIVYLFFPTHTPLKDECAILARLAKYRIGNSEFVKLDLDQVMFMIRQYFKQKYARRPSVSLSYASALVTKNVILNLEEKTLQGDKCNFIRKIDSITIVWQNKEIFQIGLQMCESFLNFPNVELFNEFMKCFLIQFNKPHSYLYIQNFLNDGWIEFFKYGMEVLFSYCSCCLITRNEFLIKETFHERIIFIRRDETPMEIVLEKAQLVQTCLVFEDSNFYSIVDKEVDTEAYESLIYYFFYLFQ
jgi:hypothetical protein